MSSTWQFRRKKNSPVWRRVIVFLTGGVILSIGLVMLVLPGPAIVFIPLGLAILATEFRWARQWRSAARQWLRGRFQKIRLKGELNHESSDGARTRVEGRDRIVNDAVRVEPRLEPLISATAGAAARR